MILYAKMMEDSVDTIQVYTKTRGSEFITIWFTTSDDLFYEDKEARDRLQDGEEIKIKIEAIP